MLEERDILRDGVRVVWVSIADPVLKLQRLGPSGPRSFTTTGALWPSEATAASTPTRP